MVNTDNTDIVLSFIDNAPDGQVHIVKDDTVEVKFAEANNGSEAVVYCSFNGVAYEDERLDSVQQFNEFVQEYVNDPEVVSSHDDASSLGLYT